MAGLRTYEEAKQFISQLHEACQAVRDLPVVTVAQIHGLCLGGALELAAACDFRYATRSSTFSMPETKYGIHSVIEARLLANIVGWQRTKEMVYLAKMYRADQMQKWRLVDELCEDVQQLESKVAEVVQTVASYGPQAMRAQKRLVRLWEENDLVSGVEAGIDAYAGMFRDGGSEPAKYMKAFTERKVPKS
jgi:enoyl-CoA hydratase/carnithine racemase